MSHYNKHDNHFHKLAAKKVNALNFLTGFLDVLPLWPGWMKSVKAMTDMCFTDYS